MSEGTLAEVLSGAATWCVVLGDCREREPKCHAIAVERLRAEERGLSLREARAGQSSIFDVLGGTP